MSMSVVDTSMVGRLPHSAVPMAAAALAQVIFNTFTFGIGGVLLGLDTLISQAFAPKKFTPPTAGCYTDSSSPSPSARSSSPSSPTAPVILNRMPVDRAVLSQAIPALLRSQLGRRPAAALLHPPPLPAGRAPRQAHRLRRSSPPTSSTHRRLDLIYGHQWSFGAHTLNIPAYGVVGSAWSTASPGST